MQIKNFIVSSLNLKNADCNLYLQTGFSGNVVILLGLFYGGSMVTANEISPGSLSAFLLYAAYVGVAVGGLGTFYSELARGLGASTRLWSILDREPALPIAGS